MSFKYPDPSNPESLKEFFNNFDKLKNSELAVLANVSSSTIRRWKRICGLSKGKKPITVGKSKRERLPDPPEDWDNAEWFRDVYENKKYGVKKIADILGRSRTLVSSRLDRYGIKTRTHEESTKSNNKFNNKAWLVKHYIEMRWPIRKCAEAAGVENQTIYDWLIVHKIKIRDASEAAISARSNT